LGDAEPRYVLQSPGLVETVRDFTHLCWNLTEEQKNALLAEEEKKRHERRRQERERFEATSHRLNSELRSLPSGVEKTAYHEAKGIEPLPGVPVRNGDLLVPGYDVEGKLWTIQYIKEDGTKRFAKDSWKHGCFHVVGAANAAEGLQKLAKLAGDRNRGRGMRRRRR
jgi:phage/plasmid primase-like uncharacterized protein